VVQQTVEEFVEEYKAKCQGHVRDLWDAADTKFVEALYAPVKEDEDDDRDR
jgi:hypothetical protein